MIEIRTNNGYVRLEFYWAHYIANCYKQGLFDDPLTASCIPTHLHLALDLMLHGY